VRRARLAVELGSDVVAAEEPVEPLARLHRRADEGGAEALLAVAADVRDERAEELVGLLGAGAGELGGERPVRLDGEADAGSLGVLQELDRLGVDRVYANYWVAYRLAFDTRERIVAAQNPYTPLAVEHGRLVPFPDPRARYQPFQRDVRASSHGFVYFRYDPIPRRVLTEHGYRRHLVGPFAVYARG